MRSPIMQRLKAETSLYHTQLEANPRSTAVLSDSITIDSYLDLLTCFYGFYLPLEQQLARLEWLYVGFNYNARRKVPGLEADLSYLGIDRAVIPVCPTVPEVATLAQAVGTLYVIEGATLGGQIIRRHLQSKLGLDAGCGASFFCSYGDQVGPMWMQYMAFATECALNPETEDEIVAAAVRLFTSLHGWMSQPIAELSI